MTELHVPVCFNCKLHYLLDDKYQCFNRNSPYLRSEIPLLMAKTKTCDAFQQKLTSRRYGQGHIVEKSISQLEQEVEMLTRRLAYLQTQRKTLPRRG